VIFSICQNHIEDLIVTLKQISKDLKLKLFLEDRKLLLKSYKVWEICDKDCLVLQDRSYISSLVYQNIYNKICLRELMDLNEDVFYDVFQDNPIRPDIIFYLKADADVIFSRMSKRKKMDSFDEFAKYHIKEIIKKYDDILWHEQLYFLDEVFSGKIKVIDANKPVKECVSNVVEYIKKEVI
jgi:thymidylate kinase